MSRPMALVLVLLVLVLTSQSDWKQDVTVDSYDNSSTVSKQEVASTNLEVVRKEIILMQEKEIYDLNQQVKSLKEQMKKCQCEESRNYTVTSFDMEGQAHTSSYRRDELNEPVVNKSTKLRGSGLSSRGNDFPERPSELSATIDALEMGDDDEEKIGDR